MVMNTDPDIMHVKDKDVWVVICIHVDDIFPVYNEAGRRLRNQLAKVLSDRVQVKFMGEVDWALKTRIFRDRKNGFLKI